MIFMFVLASIAAILLPDLAMAAPNAISQQFVIPGSVSNGDDSLCILQEIFGQNVVSNAWAPQGACLGYGNMQFAGQISNALYSSMAIYTSACFALVGLIVTYWWIIAAMTGASTGQPMHTLINPVWAPIRVAFSSAMLASTKGYALIQFVILYLVGAGVGLADNVWVTSVNSFTAANGALNAQATIQNVNWMQMRGVVDRMFDMELCKIFVNTEGQLSQANSNGQPAEQYIAQASGPPPSMQGNGYSYWINVYNQNSSASSEQQNGACGVLQFSSMPAASSSAMSDAYGTAVSTSQSNQQAAIQGLIQSIDNIINSTDMVNVVINQQQVNAPAQTTAPDPTTLSQPAVNQDQLYQAQQGALTNAINQYATAMAMNSSSVQLSGSVANGWFWAGDYYQNMESSMGLLVNLASSVPSFPSDYAPLTGSMATAGFAVPTEWQRAMEQLENEASYYENNFGYQPTSVPPSTGGPTPACSGNLMPGIPPSYISSMTNSVGTEIAAIIMRSAEDSNGCVGNLLLAESQMGKTLSDIGMGLVAGGSLATIFSNVVGKAANFTPSAGKSILSGITKMTGTVTKGITYIGIVAFFSGIWLQYVLPELPSLYWLAFCIGWLIIVIELVLAGPVWAVAHAIPEGPGFAGSMARRGYMSLLGVMAYPTLGIFALLASLALLNVAGSIVLKYYFHAAQNLASLNDTESSIVGSIAYAFLYISVLTVITGTILNMISNVPKAVLALIGSSTNHISDSNIAGAAHSTHNAITGLGHSISRNAAGVMDSVEAAAGMAGEKIGRDFIKPPSTAAQSENETPGSPSGEPSGGPIGREGIVPVSNSDIVKH